VTIDFITSSFNNPYAPYIVYIRHMVFTVEQNINASEDLDGYDQLALHVLAKIDGHYVGTGRIMPDGHIGRLAVLKNYRGKEIGSNIIKTLIMSAKKQKLKQVYLGAQCVATTFYHKLGFEKYGDVFQEVDIDHIMMKKTLTASNTSPSN